MNFLEQVELAENGEFQAKVRQAAITAAVQVMNEKSKNTPQAIEIHKKRAAFAVQVLQNPTNWQRPLAMAVVSNVAITPESLDSDVQWTVNEIWNAFAGVSQEPEK